MVDRLFVYGTLARGEPNYHILEKLNGTWEPASVRGKLYRRGWGAALGYPAIVLDDCGDTIIGQLFTSSELGANWDHIDQFEGDAYQRTEAKVLLEDGSTVAANIYVLAQIPDDQ